VTKFERWIGERPFEPVS